jgi:protein disulfide isomerase
MKVQALFLILVIGLVWSDEPSFESDEGVAVLTDSNFDDVVNHFEHVLVMFYAPWCGHCKKLKPEYKAAATVLVEEGSDIKIAMVDCTEEKETAGKFEVQGYPTLKFFIGGSPIDYQGPRDKDGILKWLNKKTQPSTSVLSDSESFEAAQSGNDVLVVFFGSEDSTEFATW